MAKLGALFFSANACVIAGVALLAPGATAQVQLKTTPMAPATALAPAPLMAGTFRTGGPCPLGKTLCFGNGGKVPTPIPTTGPDASRPKICVSNTDPKWGCGTCTLFPPWGTMDAFCGPNGVDYKTCFVGAVDHRSFVVFDRAVLAGVTRAIVSVSSAGPGGTITLRANAPDGPILASFEVAPNGEWERWFPLESPLEPTAEPCDLHVVFENAEQPSALMNLDWVEFR